jgi:HK97 family phage major capsid protein
MQTKPTATPYAARFSARLPLEPATQDPKTMTPRLKALLDKKQALINEARALEAKADWDDNDKARFATLPSEMDACEQAIEEAKAFSTIVKNADTALNGGVFSAAAANAVVRDIASDVAARYRGKVRNFSGSKEEATRKAYRFGRWMLATRGHAASMQYCEANGLPLSVDQTGPALNAALGHSEGINEDGGYLVPPEFESEFIDLREQYGVFRQFARMRPMGSDTSSRPRRTGGLTAYPVGEAEAGTASRKGWDRVRLTARKWMVLTYTSTELNEDAIISLGDDLAGEIAYAFSAAEDDCGFNGDGTSTYNEIVGIRTKIYDVYGAGGGVGLVLAAGNAYSEVTLPNFNDVVGSLPQYADTPNTGWYCHKKFYHGVMEKLMLASGGVTAAEVAAGRRTLLFMGYPVHISQKMPKTEANSQVPVLFGDLRLASDFGDRRQTTIAFSEHAAFTTDEIAIRGTERFDINNHDVGNTTDAGPVVGLVLAAS